MRRAAGSVFRRRRRGELEEKWSISYRVDGRRVTERAYADKAASEQLLAIRLREAASGQAVEGVPLRRRRIPAPPDLHEDPIETAIAALRSPHPGLQQLGACALAHLATLGRRLEREDLRDVQQLAAATADPASRQALAAVLTACGERHGEVGA
ncbi:MAG: hypothetical protein JNL08_05850 [Planctomycetes bacterium]|nr:hypothetical protein [Planctomycetota bacterium]